PLPADGAVRFERVGVGHAGQLATGVVVMEKADVVAEVAYAALVAAVEVPLQAAAGVGAGICEPAHVRGPRAGVEPARVRVIEAALERRLAVGLADAAEDILADEADIATERVLGVLGEDGRRNGGCRERGGEQRLAHERISL